MAGGDVESGPKEYVSVIQRESRMTRRRGGVISQQRDGADKLELCPSWSLG